MIGNLTDPYSLTPFQLTQGIEVLNGVLKALQAEGNNVFRQTPTTLTANPGSRTVAIPNDVSGIEEARLVTSSTFERQLGRFQWADYMMLPTKDAPGPPTIFMFDYQVVSTQMYVWPVPIISMTINCTVIKRTNDIIQQSDAIELPSEWILGFTYMVADALMEDQGVAAADPATAQRITERAVFWKDKLLDFDRPTSVFLRPYGRRGAGPFWRGR